jgi:hypothetical protein
VWTCTPGSFATTCANGTARSVCNPDGQGFSPSACPAAGNAAPTCASGMCGFTCNAGYGDCDGNPGNGCESNLQTSAMHCGACGRACAPGHASKLARAFAIVPVSRPGVNPGATL